MDFCEFIGGCDSASQNQAANNPAVHGQEVLLRRPRVLLLAYTCSPTQGSEPGIGWNRAVQTARYCDTWLLCEARRADETRRYCCEHGEVPGLQIIRVPHSRLGSLLRRVKGMQYVGYNLWHRRAYRMARQLHKEVHFDLVHMVNFCGFREPGYLWRLDAPFVWGPVGGTQYYPARFLVEAGVRGAIFETVRNAITWWQLRFSRRVRQATRRAEVLLTANSTVERQFREVHRVEPVRLLETGISIPARATRPPRAHSEDGKLRILWAGNIESWKAPTLMLKAAARLPHDLAFELRIMGQGRQQSRCSKLANRLGIDRSIKWLGQLNSRDDVREQFAWANVLLFTSLRDTSGNVVLEAFEAGVPVVCLDHQGVHDMVTEECGIKIPVTNPRKVIDGIAEAIASLGRDRALRNRLAAGALRRADFYQWNRQGDRMVGIYRRLLKRGFCWTPRNGEQKPVAGHDDQACGELLAKSSAGTARHATQQAGEAGNGSVQPEEKNQ